MASIEDMKKQAARAALDYVTTGMVLGVGTGSTVHYFIEELAKIKSRIEAVVASSIATEKRLKQHGFSVADLNSVNNLPLYVDGADEFNPYLSLIKGGGGALTREKILAASAKLFICIVDQRKQVDILGQFPLPIEVIPMARGYVAREMVKLGGDPEYRLGFTTDNGNIILDVHNLNISEPVKMEHRINNIVGVVANGIFAERGADKVLMGTAAGVKEIVSKVVSG